MGEKLIYLLYLALVHVFCGSRSYDSSNSHVSGRRTIVTVRMELYYVLNHNSIVAGGTVNVWERLAHFHFECVLVLVLTNRVDE